VGEVLITQEERFRNTYYYKRGRDAEDRFQHLLEDRGYKVQNIGWDRTPIDLIVEGQDDLGFGEKFYIQMKYTYLGHLHYKKSDIRYWYDWEKQTDCWVYLIVEYDGCYYKVDWKNGFDWEFLCEVEEEPIDLPLNNPPKSRDELFWESV
jgi:hypothetical protein